MPKNKKSVTAWLSNSDKAMVDELCRETGMSASKIVVSLLQYVCRDKDELARIIDENIKYSLNKKNDNQ